MRLQGYLTHERTPTPRGPPEDSRPRPMAGPWEMAIPYERDTPVEYSLAKVFIPDDTPLLQVYMYLAYEETQPPRTLPLAYAQGPMGVLGGWALSYGRDTPVETEQSSETPSA